MQCCVVEHASARYTQIKQLRQDVLRTPIGKILSEKDIAGEESQIHICTIDNDNVVASVILKPLENGTIKLRQMAVADAYQGRGLGATLVRFAEDVARQRGFTNIELSARLTAQIFYEKLGYSTTGYVFEEVSLHTIKMIKTL